jgi:hypothetical protein
MSQTQEENCRHSLKLLPLLWFIFIVSKNLGVVHQRRPGRDRNVIKCDVIKCDKCYKV